MDDGQKQEATVVTTFTLDQSQKEYMIYSYLSKDESGATEFFVNAYDPTGQDDNLYPLLTEGEWNFANTVFRLVRGGELNPPEGWDRK